MPSDHRSFETIGPNASDQDDKVESVMKRQPTQLARSEFGGEEVSLLDSAGEASVCRALTCHQPMGPARRF
jgi:hypothetical protein